MIYIVFVFIFFRKNICRNQPFPADDFWVAEKLDYTAKSAAKARPSTSAAAISIAV